VAANATNNKHHLALFFVYALIVITGLSVNTNLRAQTVVPIPREHGALHQELKNLMREQISQLENSIGRIELKGVSDDEKCIANFYVNEHSTFLTISVPEDNAYKEFYIDHPTQSFKPILFQKLILSDDGVELKIVQRRFTYSIKSDNRTLTINTKSKSRKDRTPSCSFDLSEANLYEGETE